MAKIKLGNNETKKHRVTGLNGTHIIGYDIPLPDGRYYHRQYLKNDLAYMEVSRTFREGFCKKSFKIGYSEEPWDFKIGNKIVLDHGGPAREVSVDYNPKKKTWTLGAF
jgi:hypothetical protein